MLLSVVVAQDMAKRRKNEIESQLKGCRDAPIVGMFTEPLQKIISAMMGNCRIKPEDISGVFQHLTHRVGDICTVIGPIGYVYMLHHTQIINTNLITNFTALQHHHDV